MGRSPGLWLYLVFSRRSQRRAARRPAETTPRPAGHVLWFHAGAPGGLRAAHELIGRLLSRRTDVSVLLTTSDDFSEAAAHPERVIVAAMPEGGRTAAHAFLDYWRPDLALWTGGALYPPLLVEAHARGLPVVLADARLDPITVRRWRWAPLARRSLLGRFALILTGTRADAATLHRLGAPPSKVETPGFLDEGTPALPCNEAEREALARCLATRPVWLAAPVVEGETEAVLAAHGDASRLAHRLLLILVPESVSEAALLRQSLEARGWRAALRSTGEEPDQETQIYIADTEGEMGLWYRLAPVTFLGRSLATPGGGHNPYEPAALGSAIIHGPNTGRFAEIFDRLRSGGAARRIASAGELGAAVADLLAPDRAAEMAHQAWLITSSGAEVTDRLLGLIDATLPDEDER